MRQQLLGRGAARDPLVTQDLAGVGVRVRVGVRVGVGVGVVG